MYTSSYIAGECGAAPVSVDGPQSEMVSFQTDIKTNLKVNFNQNEDKEMVDIDALAAYLRLDHAIITSHLNLFVKISSLFIIFYTIWRFINSLFTFIMPYKIS